jgi:hypothetical protein
MDAMPGSPGPISQFVVYEHPKDHPSGYVVREWTFRGAGLEPGEAWSAATLEDARDLLPDGLTRIAGRDPQDPVILEVWM